MQETWEKIDQHVIEHLLGSQDELRRVIERSREAGLRSIEVSPLQGQLLKMFVQMQKCSRILEVGTLGGYSAICMAKGMDTDGVLMTLEKEKHAANVARENIKFCGLQDKIFIKEGDAVELLQEMIQEGCEKFDLIFIDANKRQNKNYFILAKQLLKKEGTLIVDNVVRAGDLIAESPRDLSILGTRELLQFLKEDTEMEATALQTVGLKGHDGFLVARFKA